MVVATDNERIVEQCHKYNMKVIMTSVEHGSPISRLYELSTMVATDLYMLIIGNEPLVDERCFSLVMSKSFEGVYYVVALTNVLTNLTDVIDFSNQKVVTNSKREVLLISRSRSLILREHLIFNMRKLQTFIFFQNMLYNSLIVQRSQFWKSVKKMI